MGKKACLALDLDYDPWTDEYHNGDEIYDCHSEFDEQEYSRSRAKERSAVNAPDDADADGTTGDKSASNRNTFKSSRTASKNKQPNPFTVILPKMAAAKNTQVLHYVPNPHRRPLFTDHVATHDGLLVQVVSFLNMNDAITLSMVSKLLQESLSVDGLFCSVDGQEGGILLPCIRALSHRLLPLNPEWRRPLGISRKFAYECLAFTESCKSTSICSSSTLSNNDDLIEPHTILSTKSPEQINTVSFCRVRWEQSSNAATVGKGPSPPPPKSSTRSGIRLSYVKSDTDDCALVSMWCGGYSLPTPGAATQQYTKTRYLPPNTKTIVEASIHSPSGSCAILATPLEHYSTERYILSMVALPSCPPEIARTCKNDRNLAHTDEHVLKWQTHLSNSWHLFSSSETHPIVSFCSQAKYVIFGSAERWGVVDAKTGSQIWSLLDTSEDILSSPSHIMRSPHAVVRTPTATTCHYQNSTTTSSINAYLLHHEFLFVLERNGTLMRVYDVSNTSREPLAEGILPWSFVMTPRKKKAQVLRLHHTHQLHFCAGRIWVTGMYNFDLLCSFPPRLLRRLRSRLPKNLSSLESNGLDILSLQFKRMKTNLSLGTPHPMHTWADTLYVVDSDKVWNRCHFR